MTCQNLNLLIINYWIFLLSKEICSKVNQEIKKKASCFSQLTSPSLPYPVSVSVMDPSGTYSLSLCGSVEVLL